MTNSRNPIPAWKQLTAVIIVAIVIAIRDAYISGSSGYYVIALFLLLIVVLNFRHKATKKAIFQQARKENG